MPKDIAIQHTAVPKNRATNFNTWIEGIYNRLMICNTCNEPFREKSLKTDYVAEADGQCVAGVSVCPFCGGDSHRYARYNEDEMLTKFHKITCGAK